MGPNICFIFMTSPHFTLITVIWGSKIEIEFEIWHANYSHVCPV